MISDKKKLEISCCMYANVSARFATFCNPAYRGENFTWEKFIKHCEDNSVNWVFIHHIRGNKEEVNKVAATYAKEIAERLVEIITGA